MPRSARLAQKQLQITKEMIYEVLREEKLVGRLKKGNRAADMLANGTSASRSVSRASAHGAAWKPP